MGSVASWEGWEMKEETEFIRRWLPDSRPDHARTAPSRPPPATLAQQAQPAATRLTAC